MRRTEATTRQATVAATATTLVALIAMAAGAPGLSGIAEARSGTTQVALARGDAHAARAVAAVVMAARDLLAGTRATAVLPPSVAPGVAIARQPHLRAPSVAAPPRPALLAERLLDLPPPAC